MALGEELVIDGGFDDPNAWDVDPVWSVAAGVASGVNARVTGHIEPGPVISIEAGHTYQLIFEVTARAAGQVSPVIGNIPGTARDAIGVYTDAITANTTDNLWFRGGKGATYSFTGSIDNVSVREMIGITQGFVG